MLLDVAALASGYGNIQVLWDVSLHVDEREIVALIGSNGAGKTTLMYTLAGIIPARGGHIFLAGQDITNRRPDEIVQSGITLVPQGRRLFAAMTVEDNLLMGAYLRRDGNVQRSLEWVYAVFPKLLERRRQVAGTLSGGEQQMCAIGRALMAQPRLLCIDELSLGLAPIITGEIFAVLEGIRSEGTSILVVEQDVAYALEIADRAFVMEGGHIILSGTADMVHVDPRVREAYLGI